MEAETAAIQPQSQNSETATRDWNRKEIFTPRLPGGLQNCDRDFPEEV